MKKNDIVRYTIEELKQKPSQIDWTYVDGLTNEEVDHKAQTDPDAPPISKEQWEQAVLVIPEESGKERIAIWLDKDVLKHFGKGRKGYQTRLNQALRKVMVAELLYGKQTN